MNHLVIAPVLVPLAAAVLLLFAARAPLATQRGLSLLATVALGAVCLPLLGLAADGVPRVYALGNWPAPYGIVLVLDRLSALLVTLTAVLALASLLYSLRGTDRQGRNFHALFHLQLMGINGAFLTGDLFNLFVFFEILLIASYGLLLHGTGALRLRAGLHYVVLNLTASSLFLIAVAILYGITGTLNMADLAQRVTAAPAAYAAILHAAALMLLVVFGVKAALLPLYFWLPNAYSAAPAPVAALFAIMTKVGVYSILRVYTLVFGPGDGPVAGVAEAWLLPLALATLALGVLGALAADSLRRLVAYLTIASVGSMLAGIGLFTRDGIAAALFYMIHSTFAIAALFLLADLVARQRGEFADRLAPGPRPAQVMVLSLLFLLAAAVTAGLPPWSGFLGKILLLQAAPLSVLGHVLWAVVLSAGLIALIALARAGSLLFWKTSTGRARGTPVAGFELLAVGLPLAGLVLLAMLAGPVADFTRAAAGQLLDRSLYVTTTLGSTVVP